MQHRFFEGTEKKVELVLSDSAPDLRGLGDARWREIVAASGAHMLSCLRTEHCDAYLLSESSLFVFEHKAVMITCGRTRLVDAAMLLLDDIHTDDIRLFVYERKNEVFPHRQPTSFYEDATALHDRLPGAALRFGNEHEHHLYLYHFARALPAEPDDVTIEILMYDLGRDAAALFERDGASGDPAQARSRAMATILPGYRIDEFLFEPSGYSLNGVLGEHYATIHVTPQEHGSYASFETNHPCAGDPARLCAQVLEVFRPQGFDVVLFDRGEGRFVPPDGFCTRARVEQALDSGYRLRFLSHSVPPDVKPPFPIPLRTPAT